MTELLVCEPLRNRLPANAGLQTPSEPPSPGVLQPRCPKSTDTRLQVRPEQCDVYDRVSRHCYSGFRSGLRLRKPVAAHAPNCRGDQANPRARFLPLFRATVCEHGRSHGRLALIEYKRPPSPPATMHRSSANATQRRGRIAMEYGDGQAGAKSASSVRAPASRTGSNCGVRQPPKRVGQNRWPSRRGARQRSTPERPRRADAHAHR